MSSAKKTKYSVQSPKQINARAVKRLLAEQGAWGWSVADLARAIGHSRGTVHNILSGARPYSATIVPKIAAALGVSLNRILLKKPARPHAPTVAHTKPNGSVSPTPGKKDSD